MALKLVNERGFSVKDAVDHAYETQKKRNFIKDWKITQRGLEYGRLTSEQRAEVRSRTDKGANINDFQFEDWKVVYIAE